MAKKKQTGDPTGSMPGAAEALENTLRSSAKRLKKALEEQGIDTAEYLSEEFGINSKTNTLTFYTNSGRSVLFYELHLSYEEVADKTKVVQSVNGREQATLSVERCRGVSSIATHQYYPLIGVFDDDGSISVMDGSRRRFMYLNSEPKPIYKLRLLVTQEPLSQDEARQFAADAQTAADNTIRDDGIRYMEEYEKLPDATYDKLSEVLGVNKGVIHRAIKAAEIPTEVILYFPMRISIRQYGLIHDLVFKTYVSDFEKVTDILSSAESQKPDEEDAEYTEKLIKLLQNTASSNNDKPKQKVQTELLPEFNTKKRKVNKIINKQGVVSFQFKGVDEELVESIENLLIEKLKEAK